MALRKQALGEGVAPVSEYSSLDEDARAKRCDVQGFVLLDELEPTTPPTAAMLAALERVCARMERAA